MASLHATPDRVAIQHPPVVAVLESVFKTLDDSALLAALTGPTRRGPKGHPVTTLWRCFVAKYVLGLPSTVAMIRMLHDNPYAAQACGIASPDAIPHEATFSRFFARLAKRQYLHLVKDVSRSLVRRNYAELPGFGERVAMDSTTLKAWSNGAKLPHSDPEAGWSVKKGTQGPQEFTYGWKLHLLVDCEYELPIAANVSAGNVHDSRRATHLLSEARFTNSRFNPKYVIADQGYSGRPIRHAIKENYHSRPIIQVNKTHKTLFAKEADEQATPEWKALFRQRTAIERVNSRLKGQRSLKHITTRRLKKVTLHCYLSLIAMQVTR